MKQRSFYLIHVLAAIAALLICNSALAATYSNQTEQIFATPFKDRDGQQTTLKTFKGNVILLNLWATWCSPCVEEMPALSQLQNKYFGRGLKIVTVSEDSSAQKVEAFFKKHGISNLPVFLDDKMALLKSVGSRGLPVTILFDRQGKEVRRFPGFVDWTDKNIHIQIEGLLKK